MLAVNDASGAKRPFGRSNCAAAAAAALHTFAAPSLMRSGLEICRAPATGAWSAAWGASIFVIAWGCRCYYFRRRLGLDGLSLNCAVGRDNSRDDASCSYFWETCSKRYSAKTARPYMNCLCLCYHHDRERHHARGLELSRTELNNRI